MLADFACQQIEASFAGFGRRLPGRDGRVASAAQCLRRDLDLAARRVPMRITAGFFHLNLKVTCLLERIQSYVVRRDLLADLIFLVYRLEPIGEPKPLAEFP